MSTKEFITPFGSVLHLPNTIYNDFVTKFKKLEEKQPENYNLQNGKEIPSQWFPEDSVEERVKKILWT
jgi:hypothetical protein